MLHTLCGAAIDWDATGSFLSGTAGWAGIAALIWATYKGRQTFSDYSQQKQSEKRIEAAERVLTAAYNARTAIDGARSPLVEGAEISRAERAITENGEDLSRVDEGRRKRAATTQVFYTRLANINAEVNACWDAMPVGLAYFGEGVHAALQDIAHQRRIIQVSADSYLDDDGSDREFSKSIRRDLYRGMGKSAEDDQVAKRIATSIQLLEEQLLPILRHSAAKKAEKKVKKNPVT